MSRSVDVLALPDKRLVLVEWEDSRQPSSAWRWARDTADLTPVFCSSVGWILRHDEHVHVLAPNLGGLDDADALQASGCITIPTRCIVNVRTLTQLGDANR